MRPPEEQPNQNPPSQDSNPVSANAVTKRGLFSEAECAQLRSLPLPWKDVRKSTDWKIAQRQLIALSDDSRWIYERLAGFVTGTKALGLDIEKVHAPLKIQRYDTGGFHRWHYDISNPHHRYRKLGITVQLSAPHDYREGDFQFFNALKPVSILREMGCGVIYPSYMVHQVAPVAAGTRYSLTAWVIGPPLR